MLGIRLFGRSKTTKYLEAETACFGSLLEFQEHRYSFISVFDEH